MKHEVVLRFDKKGKARFLSHLDLLRMFQRSIRRAELPMVLTQGFAPRMKISITPAVKLGTEAEGLEAKIVLRERMETKMLKQRLQEQLPMGLVIEEVKEINV
jgi:radical SAM-linked protein